VPLGLEEEPSTVEQSPTATVVGHSTKRQRIKSCKFSKHKASMARLEGVLNPNGINARALAATLKIVVGATKQS
jgi:hypothetical protein